tara:strand:- start:274 stop:825 length:552 start_codon:yes stop_codon:yes gene_type:complete
MATIFAILVALSNPLGLVWDQRQTDLPQIEEFRYWYGDLEWGKASYLGTSDIAELETELFVEFASNNKLARATLILGPTGLNEANCIVKFKEVNRLLELKYGPIRKMTSTRDPLLDDMLYYRECYALQTGMQEHEAVWHWKDFMIKSVVFGDEDNIWIEIEYTKKSLQKNITEEEIQKIIKRL